MSGKNELMDLRFQMFGRLSAFYQGEELKLDKSGTTKVMQLLAMLIYFREGVSREVLLQNLYGDKELADMSNNLRVTVFKLRKLLVQAGLPDDHYIMMQSGVYRWVSKLPVSCDVWDFQEHIQKADIAQSSGQTEEEIEHRRQACTLYTDEFLRKLACEDWVIVESIPLKRNYVQCLRQLCVLLEEKQRYQEIVDLCSAAEAIYPYDEWQLTKIDALMAMQRYDEALVVYQEFTERYFEELGLSPTKEMLLRYQEMCRKTQRQCSSVDEVYETLVEETAEMGASYVSYPNFIDRFRFLHRLSERSGESNFLVVMTLELRKSGQLLEGNESGSLIDELVREVVQKSLRRTDTFSRYNDAQYLMLLVGINLEAIKIVSRRIEAELQQESSGRKLMCRFRAVPMRQLETKRESFGWSFRQENGRTVLASGGNDR